MAVDAPAIWLPPRPAIVRPAEHALLRPGAFRPCSRAERAEIICDLVRSGRLAPGQARRAMLLVPVVGWATTSVLSWSFLASGTGTISTVTIPGSIAANDLCFIFNVAENGTGSPPSTAVPSGFTQLRNTENDSGFEDTRVMISAKKLTGSETTVTGMTGTKIRWIALTFRPSTSWTSFADNDSNSTMTGNNPAAQTITIGGATAAAIAYGHMYSANGTVSPRTTSPSMNEVSPSTDYYAHYLIYNSSPSNISYDMDDEGRNNTIQSGWLSFT